MTKQTIPTQVKEAAKDYMAALGQCRLKYLGKYEGGDAYVVKDTCKVPRKTGFPMVYLYREDKVIEISGFDALDVLGKFY